MSVFWSVLGALLTVHAPIAYNLRGEAGYKVFGRVPYCAVDPTCESIVRPGSGELLGGGFAQNEFGSMNKMSGLAVPNFVLFLLANACLLLFVRTTVAARWLANVLIAAIIVWAWCEVNRWWCQLAEPNEVRWVSGHLAADVVTVALLVGANALITLAWCRSGTRAC